MSEIAITDCIVQHALASSRLDFEETDDKYRSMLTQVGSREKQLRQILVELCGKSLDQQQEVKF